ncbi:contractile injection system tape measure protein [Chitinophagaceae bacterium 26-R-25]|nr:contractile injection system tape measure protein [Chitinophagaceae bacterium 26-R-25]
MRHVIKKQIIDIRTSNRQNAFRLQHLMSAHYYNEIVEALEEVFDKCCGEDETIAIDLLEVDFGTVSENDLEKTRWDELFLARFKTTLLERIKVFSANKSFTAQTATFSAYKQWLFYIQHGYLNWNATAIDKTWLNNVLEALATDYSSVTILREFILKNNAAANRIVAQHDTDFLARLTETLTAQPQKNLANSVKEIYAILEVAASTNDKAISLSAFLQTTGVQIIRLAATVAQYLTTEKIVTGLLHKYITSIPVQKKKQQQLLAKADTTKALLREFMEKKMVVETQDSSLVSGKEKSEKKEKDNGGYHSKTVDNNSEKGTIEPGKNRTDVKRENEPLAKPSLPVVANEPKPALSAPKDATDKKIDKKNSVKDSDSDKQQLKNKKPGKQNEETVESLFKESEGLTSSVLMETSNDNSLADTIYNDTIPEEGIFIKNAGIVLVHPFLKSLFKRLQWIEDGYFVNTTAQLKAIFMLHYLATGETSAPEYELVLCKHICGYPVAGNVPAEMTFSPAELDEANDMLIAMIEQWDKLGNTSVAGLREGFLQRRGKLFVTNDIPTVQVEMHGIDILLDYLPWHLSVVRLPWRKNILRVEWRK